MPTITLTISSDRLESLTDIVSLTCARCVRDGSVSINVSPLIEGDDLDSALAKARMYTAHEPDLVPQLLGHVAKPTPDKWSNLDNKLKARWFDLSGPDREELLLKHVCTTCRAQAGTPCKTAGGNHYAVGMGHASRARLAARMYFVVKS